MNGLRLHYLDWGNPDAPPLLLVHGGSTNLHVWDLAAVALADRYHIVAFDQRGHGDSDWAPDGGYASDVYVNDLKGVIDALGLAPVLLVGHSMGGSNSLAFTVTYPEIVCALVMVDAGPGQAEDSTERAIRAAAAGPPAGSFDAFVETVQGYTPWWPLWQIRRQVRHSVRPLPDGQWTWKGDPVLRNADRRRTRHQSRATTDRWAVWDKVHCPALIVRGALSRILPPESAQEMHARHPNSRLVEIQKAGHRVMEDNPAEFVRALQDFLDPVVTGAGS